MQMVAQRITQLLTFTVLLTATVGCNRVRPDAPVQQAFEPAIPDPISYVAGHITFPIAELEAKINESLNPVLVNEETFRGRKGEAWNLRVVRTGPVKIQYANQEVSISAPLQVWYSNPIGLRKEKRSQKLCALSVNLLSPLSIGSNWRLNTRSQFRDYTWIEKPKIKLLGINIGITSLAESILNKRRADIEAAIDKAVHKELRLDRNVRKIWLDMQKPLRISKEPEEIWLIPRPFSVAAAPVFGDAERLTVPLQIAFRVDTHVGPEPAGRPVEALPRLLRRDKLPELSRLHVLASIPYADINRVLASRLTTGKLDLMGGRIAIKKASVYGNGRSLILKTDVRGAVHGTLFFRGQPDYDTLTNTLIVRHVDFDVATKGRLLATADWLLHDHLRDTLQAALVIPLNRQISELPGKIETAFARGKVGQKTGLDVAKFRMVPQRIVVRPDGVQILISVQSEVGVLVKKL